MIDIEKNLQEYITRVRTYLGHRPGIEQLINYISTNTDLKTAPHSTAGALSVEGGCIRYALVLHDVLLGMLRCDPWKSIAAGTNVKNRLYRITEENIAAVALLGALDNAHLFTQEPKNQKTYDIDKINAAFAAGLGHQVKVDSKGQYLWESVSGYAYNDLLPLGNGAKAIALLMAYTRVSADEMLAIRWGKTGSAGASDRGALYATYRRSPLTIMVNNAQMTIEFIIENEDIFGMRENYGNPHEPRPKAGSTDANPSQTSPEKASSSQASLSKQPKPEEVVPFAEIKEISV